MSHFVGLDRFGLAPGPVQRQHQLAAQPLAQGMRLDQRLELADERSVAAERQVGFDPLLDSDQAQLLEPSDLGLGEWLVGEVRQRRATPELECPLQALRGTAGIARLASRHRRRRLVLEAMRIEFARPDADQVSARARGEHRAGCPPLAFRLEDPSQLGDIDLERVGSARRRLRAPELVDQPVPGDDLARVHQQDREQCPLLRRRQRERLPLVPDLEWPEDAEFHRSPSSLAGVL